MSRDNRPIGQATIMMVDDEPTTLDVMEMFLRAEGYEDVVKYTEPEQVLPQLAQVLPDLLLLNLMMPGITGFDVLAVIRDDALLRRIPVILMTSASDPKIKRRAFELGAADFLAKPVDPSELGLRVRNILAVRGAREGRGPELSLGPRLRFEPARIEAIVGRFVARLEGNLTAMEASLVSGSMEELTSLAHWLKGSAGTVGLHQFTQPAELLHQLARDGKSEEIETAITELRELAERIEDAHVLED